MRYWRAAAIAGFVLIVGFGTYIGLLFRELEHHFTTVNAFLPTQIYSDVTRITPNQTRDYLHSRLKALGYSPRITDDQTQFKLHPVNYPAYLLPLDAATLQLADQLISLVFDGPSGKSLLVSIQVNEQEIPELYLEPELVSTLSREQGEDNQIRRPLQFSDIPSPVWQAIIAVEDQHFLDHRGFDLRGIVRAVLVNLKTFSFSQGGSTLTQQLVKNLSARRTKSLVRKFNELFLSILLEFRFSKEEILERYLNEVYLGQIGNLEVHGVAEGAKYFFGKNLDELNIGEIALMAGLIRGPVYYSPYRHLDRAIQRQRTVLKKMVETGQIDEEEAKQAEGMPVRLAPPPTTANKAPFFTDYVKAELIIELSDRLTETEISDAGFRVYTTLDPYLSLKAQKALEDGVNQVTLRSKPKAETRIEGALASVEVQTGFIRVLIGGKNYSESTFNRILNMKRQAGSTFKPFVYLAALLTEKDPQGIPYGAGYPLEDSPLTVVYQSGKQKWSPKNYDAEFRGWVTLKNALIHSLNTPTARLALDVGLEKVIETAHHAGIESPLPKVPSVSLGVAEVSPIELLNAYTTFANRGVMNELTVIRAVTENNGKSYARFVNHSENRFDAKYADLLTHLLEGVMTEGTGRSASQLGFDRTAAGKTGTTSEYRDAWFAGYTPELSTVVWVGVDKGTDQAKMTGASAALPIWVNFMDQALSNFAPTPFVQDHLETVAVDRKTGKKILPGCAEEQLVNEKYLKENLPEDESCAEQWPQARSTIELD